MPGLYFEDFEVGKTYRHPYGRTVTETDNLLFTSLTMNTQTLHLDEEFARTTQHGARVVNSIFTLGLLVGMRCVGTNGELVDALRARKLLAVPAGDNVVRFLPPLIVEESHVDEALDKLGDACRELAAR